MRGQSRYKWGGIAQIAVTSSGKTGISYWGQGGEEWGVRGLRIEYLFLPGRWSPSVCFFLFVFFVFLFFFFFFVVCLFVVGLCFCDWRERGHEFQM